MERPHTCAHTYATYLHISHDDVQKQLTFGLFYVKYRYAVESRSSKVMFSESEVQQSTCHMHSYSMYVPCHQNYEFLYHHQVSQWFCERSKNYMYVISNIKLNCVNTYMFYFIITIR